jgi:hypothetical protein
VVWNKCTEKEPLLDSLIMLRKRMDIGSGYCYAGGSVDIDIDKNICIYAYNQFGETFFEAKLSDWDEWSYVE